MKPKKIGEQKKLLRSNGWSETRKPMEGPVAGVVHTNERFIVLYYNEGTKAKRFYVKKRSDK